MRKFTLGLNNARNMDYIQKGFKPKFAQNLISYKKLAGCISISIPGVELKSSKDLPFLKYIL